MSTAIRIHAQKKPIGHMFKVLISLLLFMIMPFVIWFEYNNGYLASRLEPQGFSWTPTIIFLSVEIIITLALLASIFINLRRYYRANKLQFAGSFTTGKIGRKEKRASRSGYVGYFFVIDYQYAGRTVELLQRTSKANFNSTEPGAKVSIKYLPSDPTIARAEL